MNLNQLYYFRKLAELQHFTNTATELFISQPSLSYSISNLERELGTCLFEKEGRNIVLSDHGKEFYHCVSDVLTRLDEGISSLKKSIEISSYEINIGTIPMLFGDIIPKNIRSYMNSFPQSTFSIFTCTTNNEVISGIKNGIYNIGFCFNVVNDNDLVFVPIKVQELVVITKVGHELSKKKKIDIFTIQQYPLITYRENNPLCIPIHNLFKEHELTPNIVFSFDEEITISEMVAQNFGIAILPNIPVLQNLNISIQALDIKTKFPILYMVYRKKNNNSKYIKNFIRHLKEDIAIN